jgi:hypothetical protein
MHRGKISKDRDNDLWAGVCDCGFIWNTTRWRDVFDVVFSHVRGRRKGQALGIGFGKR